METSSEHPLAKAVVETAERRQLNLPQMSDFKTVTGRGVEGKVNGQTYRIGRPEWVEEQNLTLPSSLRQELNTADERGESAVVLMTDQSAIAVISMADQVRERAREAVNKLKAKNIQVIMITDCDCGD